MAPGEGKSPEAWPEMKVPLRYWHVVFDTLQGFSKNTSVGGISNAYRSLHTIRRLVWLSLFLVGCYFTVKDVVGVFNEYFSYPVITTVGVSHKETVTFPAVTVCNQNRIRCSMLIKSAFNASSGVDSDLLKISGCMDTMESCETVWEEIISAGNVDPTGLYEDSPCHYDCEFLRSWMMDLEGTQETQDLAKQLLDFGGCEDDHDHHMWTMSSSQQSPMAETPVSTATQETQAGGSKQQTQSTQQKLPSLSTLEPTIPSLQTASPTQQGTESTQETTESTQQTLTEEFPAQEGQSPPEEIGTRKKRRAPSMRNSYDDNDYYDDDYYHSDFGGALHNHLHDSTSSVRYRTLRTEPLVTPDENH
ncbi:pickpocket 12 [Oratosquilla oratoria]|uniref:pickpocket 12 n=1 Tax=Oratosquilla oratoria TaxID=337810 RepID=UPI003F7662DF